MNEVLGEWHLGVGSFHMSSLFQFSYNKRINVEPLLFGGLNAYM
jgi:hypothetical protein